MFQPHFATFKDVDAIKGYIKTVISKVEDLEESHKVVIIPVVKSGCRR
jgi:hypothetical protein